jgi:phenylacetate-CoA ligase|tara:strand:- start:37 stop:1410 length:1374 start_codon:yes stop_codon:yes gene_type:complete
MKEALYQSLPNILQNVLITLYNYNNNRVRYSGRYNFFRDLFKTNSILSASDLERVQKEKYSSFLKYSVENSSFFRETIGGIPDFECIENISKLPILSKEIIRTNLNEIYTISKDGAVISKTGGTTGKSLEVYFTKDDFQERIAMLDNFRSNFGYELGKKTACFSGKSILNQRDVRKKRFWKKDYLYNVKYYSTFHIKTDYLKYYIIDLIKFQPEYLVGFPSNILEISKYGLSNNMLFPKGVVKAIFPTAETVTPLSRKIIESYFHCSVYDQYASSEGAPFIVECSNKKLHLELQSGVFEVLNNNNTPAAKGKLLVTAFATHGTPLIRYDIGDSIELSHETCTCGNNNPLVKEIFGRIDDYVYSPETGKINLGNVSNTLKDTHGIVKFQAIQNELNHIVLNVIIDETIFTEQSQKIFHKNWVDRVGKEMILEYVYVKNIPVEKSGKFRIVKNNIKDLI